MGSSPQAGGRGAWPCSEAQPPLQRLSHGGSSCTCPSVCQHWCGQRTTVSVTPPGPRNRFLWADPGACLPPGKAPPQRLLGLSFPVSSMIKKAKQTRMSHLRMSRLGLWQRATCRLGASTPKPASNQTRLRASVRAVSFNHVTEEHGRLQAGGGGHGTYEAGQAAGGFHALAASPPPECPGVGPSEAVHGHPPLGIELAVGLQVQPTAAGPGMHGFTPPRSRGAG